MTTIAAKKQKFHCLSDDFLKANQHFKIVVGVLTSLVRDLGFDTRAEYNVVGLFEFSRYTYVYSKKFSHGMYMDEMMEKLADKGVGVDLKQPEQRRFRVCLSIPLSIAEEYMQEKLYKEAVRLSPVYENVPIQSDGHATHAEVLELSSNGNGSLPQVREVEIDTEVMVPTHPPIADPDNVADGLVGATLEDQVKLVAKRLGLSYVFARKGQENGFVCQLHIRSEQTERESAYNFYKRAGFDIVASTLHTGEDGIGKVFRFRSSVPDLNSLKELMTTALSTATDTTTAEIAPVETEGRSDKANSSQDEAVLKSLTIQHPKSILNATVRKKKHYLSSLVTKHGNGLKLKWVSPPIGEEQDDGVWRVKDSSGERRDQDLQDLLSLWGYDVSPRPARTVPHRGLPSRYFYLNRLEPTELAQFYDDGKVAHKKRMQELKQQLIPGEDLVATKDLESVQIDWHPNMRAEELVNLLRQDIRALSKIANLAHIQELSAETLAGQVLEAMEALRAVPIVESTELKVSVGNGFRVGLAVRADVFKSMLTERILYLSLRNSLFKFRDEK